MLINGITPDCEMSRVSVQPSNLRPVNIDEKKCGYFPNFHEKSVLTLESWVASGTYECSVIESKCICVGIFLR